uniref:Related to retinol dehydrogenase 12 n=1 Tax=Ramularia collo-cygni TaxID=112498 RepID=A0A2D3UTS8_9PEZI
MFGSSKTFSVDDIPDLSGKTILVTGGNSGLGAESCLQFAKHGSPRIFLAARSREKAEQAIANIKAQVPDANITFLSMDLADLESVKKAAEQFIAESSRLDILLNNAGILGSPPGLTKDGFEVTLGTNHVGHALLTKLLLPVLQETAQNPGSEDVRIVNVSSRAYKWAPNGGLAVESALTTMSDAGMFQRYAYSKIANIYFTQELAKRYPTIKSMVIHPGAVATNVSHDLQTSNPWIPAFVWSVGTKLLLNPVARGALTQLWASCSPDAQSGKYYEPVGRLVNLTGAASDESNAAKLWEWTESQLREKGF